MIFHDVVLLDDLYWTTSIDTLGSERLSVGRRDYQTQMSQILKYSSQGIDFQTTIFRKKTDTG
jgi:hypothetical protein